MAQQQNRGVICKKMNTELSPKEQIRLSALIVNSKLDKYIKLHDSFLKQSGTLRSFIKNIFGISMPFDRFVEQTSTIEKEMLSTIKGISSTHDNIKNVMTAEEEKYFSCLLRYAQSLHQTIIALRNYQEGFLKKSKGGKFIYATSKDLLSKYKQSIDAYQEVGIELNSLSYVVF